MDFRTFSSHITYLGGSDEKGEQKIEECERVLHVRLGLMTRKMCYIHSKMHPRFGHKKWKHTNLCKILVGDSQRLYSLGDSQCDRGPLGLWRAWAQSRFCAHQDTASVCHPFRGIWRQILKRTHIYPVNSRRPSTLLRRRYSVTSY
jgi:hypothetical protein